MTKTELLKRGKEYYKKNPWCQVSMPKEECLKKLVKAWKKDNRGK